MFLIYLDFIFKEIFIREVFVLLEIFSEFKCFFIFFNFFKY